MMKQARRGLSWLLALMLCISLLSGLSLTVSAEGYVYNWGTRGATALSLSDAAEAFYTGENTYESFAAMDGSQTTSAVPQSELYLALQQFMAEKQTHVTEYRENNELFRYTDCQNGGGEISSFYSGSPIGPDWDSGKTWNKEHTWPNSKGDASGDGENDVMMLRPTAKTENGSRGNTAYGESAGYYDPNYLGKGDNRTATGHNLHGDVARIMLYVYVRWGNTERMWGSAGVMESREVLLKWLAEDPVDTWELGRNDSVQSITGTRNVFVDYPELAFQLFGEEAPADLPTPSGGVPGGAVPVNVTYLENGIQTGTVSSYENVTISLPTSVRETEEGFTFVGWVESSVDMATARPAVVYEPGAAYTVPAGGAALQALYTSFTSDSGGDANTYTLTNSLVPGEKVIIVYAAGSKALNEKIVSTYYKAGADVTVTGSTVTTADPTVVWNVTADGEGVNLINGAGQKLSIDGTYSSIPYDKAYDAWTVAAADTQGCVNIVNENGKQLCWNSKYSNFSAYAVDGADYVAENAAMQIFSKAGVEYFTTSLPKPAQYTVTFSVPAGAAPIDAMACGKEGITLPSAEAPQGYTFAGWVTAPVAETETAPSGVLNGVYNTQTDVTLYALYTTGSQTATLVTDAASLKAGDRVVIASNGSSVRKEEDAAAFTAAVAGDIVSKKYLANVQGVTFSEDLTAITYLPADAMIFTLGGDASGWTFGNDSGETIGVSGKKNGSLNWLDSNNTWTISIENGSATITNLWDGGRPERLLHNFNGGQERFTNYGPASTCLLPQLYLVSGSATWTTVIGGDSHLAGDINGDGEVNNKDLTRLFQYLSGYEVEVVEAALDINGDSSVNNKDVTRLFQYVSGYDVEIY